MSDMTGLNDLVAQVKEASLNIKRADAAFGQRLDGLENNVNELFKKTSRPGFGGERDDASTERKSAVEMCRMKHALDVPKVETSEYVPSSAQVDAAIAARRGLRQMIRHGDINKLDAFERKSLSAFSFGTNQFLMAPEMSNQVLSCLVDPSDLSGLVNRVQISAGSIKFLIDNARMGLGAWACDASCFANNPVPDLQAGLGEMEIKAESLRFVACATADLLEDASFDVMQWLTQKISDGMRITINEAILIGDGIGRPLGLLNPRSGIPVCDVSPSTPPGQFSWADLVMLKYDLPMLWHANGRYLMNPKTFALLLTMSDAMGRPLLQPMPQGAPTYAIAGSPIFIATQMPDVSAGSTPVAFGDFQKAYSIVERRQPTITIDNYTGGWCRMFKCDARIGGSTTCPNASRLLRIR
jgi:HK97 family phage major capsid protein